MRTIEDLPEEAQERLRGMAASLKEMQDFINATAPALSSTVNHLGVLVLKAHLRAEHAEMRLDALEASPVQPPPSGPKEQRDGPPLRNFD